MALDDELAAIIERLQQARTELRQILDQTAPTDLATEFVSPHAVAVRRSSRRRRD